MRTRLMPYVSLLTAATLAATACGPKQARGGTAVKVSQIELGRSLKPDLKIEDKTSTFRPTDVIYASIETKGNSAATLQTRWTFGDDKDHQQVVNESTRTISPNGDEPVRTEFHISKPDGFPEGKYHLVVTINGAEGGTKDFEVKR